MQSIPPSPTIYAVSSAQGKAGVTVLRVSGSKAWDSLQALLGKGQNMPAVRQATLCTLFDPQENSVIDRALVIGFKAPASFTGEDCVEYHCHGSPAVVEEMLAVLGQQEGHRLAEHGEFTRRAFYHGKIDLTEAEAIADLIDAETKHQKEQALLQMGGALYRLYQGWADDLVRSLAYIEAIIDFPDEDIPDSETAKAKPAIIAVSQAIARHLQDHRKGERLRDGIVVAIIGAPNAGKSSLINALTQRDIAIVSPIAGTTRDTLEAHLNIGGYPVILVDTAGMRTLDLKDVQNQGHDTIEAEGIRRAKERAQDADICLLLFDGTCNSPDEDTIIHNNEKTIVIFNKADLSLPKFHVKQMGEEEPVILSVKTQEGMDRLLAVLEKRLQKEFAVSRETPALTRQRHRSIVEECLSYLAHALEQQAPELMAQDLRSAVHALGRITGRVNVDDLLDIIFRDFCIGK